MIPKFYVWEVRWRRCVEEQTLVEVGEGGRGQCGEVARGFLGQAG